MAAGSFPLGDGWWRVAGALCGRSPCGVQIAALRIARFPAAGRLAVKERVNAITLAPADDFRRDSDLFGEGVRNPEAQQRIQAAIKRGLQTRDAEMALARMLAAHWHTLLRARAIDLADP